MVRFFFPWKTIFSSMVKLFSYHGENFLFPWKIIFLPWRIFSTMEDFFLNMEYFFTMEDFFLSKNHFVVSNDMVISGSPSGGRTGAWGLAVPWGWSHRTSPKEQTARKRGGRGDCACWLGASCGLEPLHQPT